MRRKPGNWKPSVSSRKMVPLQPEWPEKNVFKIVKIESTAGGEESEGEDNIEFIADDEEEKKKGSDSDDSDKEGLDKGKKKDAAAKLDEL
jgi:hypothetical protein